jgi:hypothetical protein
MPAAVKPRYGKRHRVERQGMSTMHDFVQSRFQLWEEIDFYPRSGDRNLHAKTINSIDNRFFSAW